MSFLLINCAGQKPVTTIPAEIVKGSPDIPTQDDAPSAQSYVEQAKLLSSEQALPLLLQGSEQFIVEGDNQKALWLANQIQPLLENPELSYRARLVKAQALFEMTQLSMSLNQLTSAAELVQANELTHQLRYYQLLESVQSALAHPVEALSAKLHAFAMNPDASEQDSQVIWLQINQLAHWQLQQLIRTNPPLMNGWARLSSYARRFGAKEAQFERYLAQWQKQFPVHPAQTVVQQILNEGHLDITSALRIAVILPLSGKQMSAGEAAQQGILAAYQQDKSKQFHFIDANSLDWETLEQTLNEKDIEFIIGPLLRQHVNRFLSIETIEIPSLLLNLPTNIELKAHQSAISMRPEDEAIQAAASLAKKNYLHPLLMVHEDKVSQRIAQAFSKEWYRLSGKNIENISFAQGKKMQENLKSSLDVDKSQDRINGIDSRIKQTIKAEARNRRDVDMIYIIGSPVQTRLLKPYIDVSISPFADAIPIYASSRSHSARTDESETRDLTGLTFTEMPWMLPSKQQNRALFNLTNSLFPNRSDSLQGIFAMGYDSVALIDIIPHMQQRKYVRHYGQTGILKLESNNVLTRSILWGRYQKSRVQEIVMDR
ncbi:penicillin-binding protein activator [Thalassotalea atypica]|uniref:penicillin-binding protein activator n=1 Tax=Thalassotalea atypica TaxID=2054316 RepID=UPI002573810C|nr:penicillin-binding protein activator [Thalassotalea atypica]